MFNKSQARCVRLSFFVTLMSIIFMWFFQFSIKSSITPSITSIRPTKLMGFFLITTSMSIWSFVKSKGKSFFLEFYWDQEQMVFPVFRDYIRVYLTCTIHLLFSVLHLKFWIKLLCFCCEKKLICIVKKHNRIQNDEIIGKII